MCNAQAEHAQHAQINAGFRIDPPKACSAVPYMIGHTPQEAPNSGFETEVVTKKFSCWPIMGHSDSTHTSLPQNSVFKHSVCQPAGCRSINNPPMSSAGGASQPSLIISCEVVDHDRLLVLAHYLLVVGSSLKTGKQCKHINSKIDPGKRLSVQRSP